MKAVLRIIICCFYFLFPGPLSAQFGQGAYFDSVFTEYFRLNSGGWTAGDATISVPLSDGRTIWLFGDSYIVDVNPLDNTLPCLFQVRNCMIVQDSVDLTHFDTYIDSTQTGLLRTFFKLGPDDPSLLWPDHGFEFNDTVYIFLEHLDSETWEFLGSKVAKLLLPNLELLEIVPLPDYGDYCFGRGILSDTAAGYRYLYGNKLNWIVWEPYVARCPINDLYAPWKFWTGESWSDNIMFIRKISDLPVSPSFSVVANDGQYFLITQENGYLTCGLGRDIYAYTGSSPTGPFNEPTWLYTEESQFNGHYLLTYNAFSHPSFTEDGELLISYNVNDWVDTLDPYICPSQCVDVWTDRMDADTYRPKFIRVPFDIFSGSVEVGAAAGNMMLRPSMVRTGVLVSCELRNYRPGKASATLCNLQGQSVGSFILEGTGPTLRGDFPAPGIPGIYIILIQANPGPQHSSILVVMP